MSLFKKNPNEAAYYEGKKHFIDVIKNTLSKVSPAHHLMY